MIRIPLYLVIFGCLLSFTGNVTAGEADVDWARHIRPVLSNHCFQCHGPDDESREADLRLDTQDGLHSVLDTDDLNASEILARIGSDDPDHIMPPPAANKPLSAEQKELLGKWVEGGAEWNQHWAFLPPEKSVVPVFDSAWVRNEIDAFALQQMQKAELNPSQDADPLMLIRRLYLDLTGLPPTPEQADDWAQRLWPDVELQETTRDDIDETQWQALITHLLESPAWGERWARRWLDLARYADTNGYEKDRDRSIWPYRDWVINAYNSGMPFDQFTIEQLAGDMLPNATQQQRVATGFHRNTMLNEEGGIDPLEFRFHAMTDRVATTGTTWLGLTLGCAQCHTHKYDPISHRDYYSFMALLNNADEPTLRLTDESTATRNTQSQEQAAALIANLSESWPTSSATESSDEKQPVRDMETAFSEWLNIEHAAAAKWIDITPIAVRSTLPILEVEDDGSVFASGDTAKRDDYWISLPAVPWAMTALQLEALPDDRLPNGGPGSTYYEGTFGDFFLNEFTVESSNGDVPLTVATASYAKDRYGQPSSAQLTIDGDVQTGWSVHDRQGNRHSAIYRFAKPVPPNTPVEVHMVFGRHFASSLGHFRFAATDSTTQPVARARTRETNDLLLNSPESLSQKERQQLLTAFLLEAPELKAEQDKIRNLHKPVTVPTTLVMQERLPRHPRRTSRHHRGEYLQPKERVNAATPGVLPSLPDGTTADRLALARWLGSPENPLTPRVVVNRHWAAFFGTGIVKTVDDFGLQGDFPTHPELLDWLAVTFVQDDAWSLRQLHRRIVSSSLYRQSSVVQPKTRQTDPDNRLLSYAPRFRLEAEMVRDRLLRAARVLNPKVGGPSVRPPQPAGVSEGAYAGGKWKADTGDSRYRRSLYTYSRRTVPFAMLTTFDGPSGESCIARRSRSNNPLQALTLLNDVMFTDLAQQAGRAIVTDASMDEDRLVLLFRRVLVRFPTEAESRSLLRYVQSLRDSLDEDPERTKQLAGLADDETANETTIETAIWAGTARAIFALDEAVMRE
jgi:mono/diheme cytochrome c family protein